MTAIRIAIGGIIVAIVAVAVVPLIVLLDLAAGGDGMGICAGGIGACRTSYFDGPELMGLLAVVLFLLLIALRAALHVRSIIEQGREIGDPLERGPSKGNMP